jgi:hypothetical protein
MNDEVENFLRRVAQMRAEAEQGKAQPRPAPPPKQPPKRREPKPLPPPARLVPARTEMPILQPVEVEVVDAELAVRGDNVGRHVAEHERRTEQIAEHARHLGEQVDLADDKLEAHLHDVFDHQLGRLKKSNIEAGHQGRQAANDLTASQIQQMLLTPQSIRDAIILGEILRRPQW